MATAGGFPIVRNPLDRHVARAVCSHLDKPEVRQAMMADSGAEDGIGDRLNEIEAELDRIDDDRMAGAIDMRRYRRMNRGLMAEAAALRSKLANNQSAALIADLGASTADWWADKNNRSRRPALVQLAVARLAIKPADPTAPRRFDSRRVDLEFRY